MQFTMNYADAIDVLLKDYEPALNKPTGLSRIDKLDGLVNFNHEIFLDANSILLRKYFSRLKHTSFSDFFEVYCMNLGIYLLPSSSLTTEHVIVDRLPWRFTYDRIFSSPVLPVLLAISFAVWVVNGKGSNFTSSLGCCLPLGVIAAVSVLRDGGENYRFKFFIEPVLYIFVAVHFHAGFILLRRHFGLKRLFTSRPHGTR